MFDMKYRRGASKKMIHHLFMKMDCRASNGFFCGGGCLLLPEKERFFGRWGGGMRGSGTGAGGAVTTPIRNGNRADSNISLLCIECVRVCLVQHNMGNARRRRRRRRISRSRKED
jgi:hypothetical protein